MTTADAWQRSAAAAAAPLGAQRWAEPVGGSGGQEEGALLEARLRAATRLAHVEALLATAAGAHPHAADAAPLLGTPEALESVLSRAAALARAGRVRSAAWGASTHADAAAAKAEAAAGERIALACLQQLLLLEHGSISSVSTSTITSNTMSSSSSAIIAPRTLGRIALAVAALTSAAPAERSPAAAAAAAATASVMPEAASAASLAAAAAAATAAAERHARPRVGQAPGGAAQRLGELLSAAEPHAALLQLLEATAGAWAGNSSSIGAAQPIHPQDAVDAAYGLATAGLAPPPAFARTLLSASRPLLARMSPKQLSLLAYSLARLGVAAPRAWRAEWAAAVARAAPRFGPQDVANALWASATLRRNAAAQAAADEPAAAIDSPPFVGASSSGVEPINGAVSALARQALAVAGGMTSQGLANSLWATATLCGGEGGAAAAADAASAAVGAPWLLEMLRRCQQRRRELRPQEAANALWAAATLLRRFDADAADSADSADGSAQQRLLCLEAVRALRDEALLPLAPRFGAADWANTLWASAALELPLCAAWQDALWLGSTRQLRSWPPAALASAAWALARLGVAPARGWWAMFEASSIAAAPAFGARELAMAAWAAGALHRRGAAPAPTAQWWERLWAATAARALPAASGSSGSGVAAGGGDQPTRHAAVALHAAADAGVVPPAWWLEAALSAMATEAAALAAAPSRGLQSTGARVARALGAVGRLLRDGGLSDGLSPSAAASAGALVAWLAGVAPALPADAAAPALRALADLAPHLPAAPTTRAAAAALLARCAAVRARPARVLHALARLSSGWDGRERAAFWQAAAAAGAPPARFWRYADAALAREAAALQPAALAAAALALRRLGCVPSRTLSSTLASAAAALAATEATAADAAATAEGAAAPELSSTRSALPALLLALGHLGCGRVATAADLAALLEAAAAGCGQWTGAELADAAAGTALLVRAYATQARRRGEAPPGSGDALTAALRAWVRGCLAATRAAMAGGRMAPDEVARAAAAVARLSVAPGDRWLSAAVDATAGRLHEAGGVAGLARLAAALRRLGCDAPPLEWQAELAAAAAAEAAAAGARGAEPLHVGALALAWHAWGWQPPAAARAALLAAARPALEARRRYPTRRLQLALATLARAGWQAPPEWAAAARARVAEAAARGACGEAQHDKMLWALQVLDGGSAVGAAATEEEE